ncbi:MAG TPA: GAF domain-containing protein [Solirubrobacteraceae bacterium]|nr:GAF domain-containing protein [Solirubrobacteraceae bacterium]
MTRAPHRATVKDIAPTLRSPWLAIDAVTDRPAHARSLRRVHDAFHSGHEVHGHVRAVVEQSWARSGDAGVDPTKTLAPIVMEEDAIADRWERHPLYPVLPVLRDLLSDATTRAGHMLVISDARGVLLWIEGHQHVVEATENMHFVCGADWSEQGAGTNALGTAIAVDHPVQIFSAEHFSRLVHPWQCSGAPIHDPESGEIIGVVDLTGHLKTAHPHTLSLVAAAAGMAEAYLRAEQQRRTQRLRELYCGRIAGTAQPTALLNAHGRVIMSVPHGWIDGTVQVAPGGAEVALPDGTNAIAEPLDGGGGYLVWRRSRPQRAALSPQTPALALEFLSARPCVRRGDDRIALGARQAELLAVLAFCPEGLTAEQLALELYGDEGKPVTVRAEVSRLRRLLGPALLARPYRFAAPVRSDFADVERMLEAGQLARALPRYTDQLLRQSEVPLVVEARQRLDGGLRNAVLGAADPELLAAWCASPAGRDDQPAAELLLGLLPADDERHPAARARAERLRRAGDEPQPPPAW